jgi:putative ABC transport system permease protein
MTGKNPPGLFLRFFRWFCHPDLQRSIEGDLLELYHERQSQDGKRKADWKFAIDVLLLLRPGVIRPATGYHPLTSYGMLKNYLNVGIRNILKYKVFSFINVFGLALAMSVCMLILLMLSDQDRYDQFHSKRDRIYRILSDYDGSRQAYATSPYPLAAALKADYAGIEESTHLHPGVGGDITANGHIVDTRGYFADPAFFKVFDFELIEGNKNTALSAPNAIIISVELAHLLFKDENPVGKTVEFSDRGLPFPQRHDGIGSPPVSWGTFTITGVIDILHYKSHLKFDALISASTLPFLFTQKKVHDATQDWTFWYIYTYVLLAPGKTTNDLSVALNDLVARNYATIKSEETKGFKLIPQKLPDIAFGLMSNDTNNRLPLIGYYFLSVLAVVIMISACLNYTNLSVARALTRAREIGVRQVTGASRKNLLFQFMTESILTAFIALMMAVVMLFFVRKAFMNLWVNRYLEFELPATFVTYLQYAGFALAIGIVAGLYPALRLSGFKPIQALKSKGNADHKKFGMRKTLTVSQFVISLFFITTSILIFNQFKHFQKFNYGFTSKHVVNVELQGIDYQQLSTELATVPGVAGISACDVIPATGRSNGSSMRKLGSKDDFTNAYVLHADDHFLANLNLHLVAGRNLSPTGEASILVNESAVRKLGYRHPAEIIGEVFETKWDKNPVEVIGVVQNFRYSLLINRDEIDPLFIRNTPRDFEYLNIKISSVDVPGTIEKLAAKWKALDPVHTFKYEFFDDQLAETHQGIFDAVSILGFASFLAIIIACLGLLGMATYTAERRTREVGIRKVLGAQELSLALLLSREFLILLAVAIVIGGPLSYLVNNIWLRRFPNRVDFGLGTVVIGVVTLLVLGLLTIGSQTLKASRRNPVDTLRLD